MFSSIFAAILLSGPAFAQSYLSNSGVRISGKKTEGSFWDETDLSFKTGYLNETEELYGNSSIYENFRIGKNFSDQFRLDLYNQVEYSKREETGQPDRERWYDNTGIVAKYDFSDMYRLEAFGSASISDETFTSYGGRYRTLIESGEFSVLNILEGGYNYFYYWNMVGQDYLSESIEFRYASLDLSLSYLYADVRNNYIEGYDIKGRNPNRMFNLGISYDFLVKPKINIGMYYQFRDYEHYSPLYYSPQNRDITGFGAYAFDTFGKFYAYFGGGIKQDQNAVFVWSVDAEAGFEDNGFSVSGIFGRYYDPFYRNTNFSVNLTKSF